MVIEVACVDYSNTVATR